MMVNRLGRTVAQLSWLNAAFWRSNNYLSMQPLDYLPSYRSNLLQAELAGAWCLGWESRITPCFAVLASPVDLVSIIPV